MAKGETRVASIRDAAFGAAALAAATLLLESTLIRLLAVAQYYHFAFLVVSLALLGFGASGTLLSISPRIRTMPLTSLLRNTGIAYGVSVVIAYGVLNFLPFDSYSIAWERRQILFFLLYYLVLALPFVFSGLGIGAALMASHGRSHLVYAANLVGSSAGALIALVALWLAGVPGAALASALLGILPALGQPPRKAILIILGSGAIGFGLLAGVNLQGRAPLGITISPYKGLAQALRYPGAQRLFGKWNAISRVDVIASAGIRQLPGLSYAYPGMPPEQYGLSLDADAPQPISLVQPEAFQAASFMPEAVAFQLRPSAHVLVLQPAGGLGVLQALAGEAAQVTAVLDNPLVTAAVARTAPAANVYTLPQVQTIHEAPRVFMQRDERKYDLIFVPLTDAYRPVTSGAYSLAESYDLTVEAFTSMAAHLQADGILVMTRWLQTPASEGVRLIGTMIAGLERLGVERPAESVVAYRGIQTVTVLVQPDGWSQDELRRVRKFATAKRYDLVWAPDIGQDEVNRFNQLPEPDLYQAVATLMAGADRTQFFADYFFDVRPPTDNHPFFFHFFTWRQTPEVFATLGKTWQPFGGSGYFVLLAMLTLALVLSGGLILAPLMVARAAARAPGNNSRGQEARAPARSSSRVRVFAYFALLGLAFLFVEIPLIQRWILLLGHPTYAFTGVVLVLLTFSSIGSTLARASWLPSRTLFALLVLISVLTPWGVAQLTAGTLGMSLPARAILGAVLLAPLAILMGLPFPMGLAWLEREAPLLVPWAWAINGCASVIASVLAAIIALSYGFTTVLLMGAGAYSLAWGVMFLRRRDRGNKGTPGP